MDWRGISQQVISERMKEAAEQGLEGLNLKQFVNAAYPFGQRKYHPYKIWLDELKKAFAVPRNPETLKIEMNRASEGSYTFQVGGKTDE